MASDFGARAYSTIKEVLPRTIKTCIWLIEITVGVSVLILLLRYFNILPWISSLLEPVFGLVGLPGEAALAYVSGYFVNVYSAIAVALTLDMDVRSLTILGVMILCSHNMIVETAVQKKTGTSALRIVITRTLSAVFLAVVLNWILPLEADSAQAMEAAAQNPDFITMLREWGISTLKMVLKMAVIVISLNIAQSLLAEFGIIRWISKFLRPLLAIFGLPAKCSFLWIIANVIGLAYGGAAMIDETHKGKLSKKDIDLTNIHICISHSNFEDLILLSAMGCVWWILLFSRWLMSMALVWGYRLELSIRNKFVPLQVQNHNDGKRNG